MYLSPTTGEIVGPAIPDLLAIKRIFFASPNKYQVAAGCDYSGETWIVEWDGSASGHVDFLTSGNSQSALGTNKIWFKMGMRPGNTQLTLTLRNRSDPPRNIRVYQERYAKNLAAGELFNPDWVEAIRNFETLRFMGWQCTNDSEITDFGQLADEDYTAWCQPLNFNLGPKGALHPSLICKLANLTGCKVHVCLPVKCTDAFVNEFATYMRDNTDVEVAYEFSNECWNFGFRQTSYCLEQGSKIWPGDGARFNKWYGYRSAQVMQIVRSIYNDSSRWRGCIATQTVSTAPLQHHLVGINHLLSDTPRLRINDLFKALYVTGYFGVPQRSVPITGISNSNPAIVEAKKHGHLNGQRIKIFIQKGMQELNDTYAIVTNADTDSFELQGVDSTHYSPFIKGNNYTVPALVFEIMDKSSAKFTADPKSYPTKYTYFCQQLAASMLAGTCSEGLGTEISVASLQARFWPAMKAIAAANGLEFRQYEGGCHFVGDAYLNGYGGQPQFTEYLINSGHSSEVGAVYAAAYSAFLNAGGSHPSKFVEAGATSQFGTWAGIRYWPTIGNGNKVDSENPVWKATTEFNAAGQSSNVFRYFDDLYRDGRQPDQKPSHGEARGRATGQGQPAQEERPPATTSRD